MTEPYVQQCLLCGGACQQVEQHLEFDYGYSMEDDDVMESGQNRGYIRGEASCAWCGGGVAMHASNCPELRM